MLMPHSSRVFLRGGGIPCILPAPAIALRRLTRTNTLLLEIITGLYDEQGSRRSAIFQSTLFPVANGESDLSNKGAELRDALGVGDPR